MEPDQPEANASTLSSDLLQASSHEEQRPFGFDSDGHGGEGDDVGPQVNQELLIDFDMDNVDTQGILQPHRTFSGTEDEHQDILQPQRTGASRERYPEGEFHGILQPQTTGIEEYIEDDLRKHSDACADSDEENPQNVSNDNDEGSPQKRLRYESADTVFGSYAAAAADDDDDNDDDEHNNRHVLKPQEFNIHVGAEADVGFDLLGPQPEEDEQQEPPEILFEPDEGTDYITDDDKSYIRQTEPSPPEADLDIAEGAPELEFEPDLGSGHNSDGDENRFFGQSLVPEDDLEASQDAPELQFEPEVAGVHDSDSEENLRFIPQSQPFVPEDDLETSQEPPELQFEPEIAGVHDSDSEENLRFIPQSQPFVPEDDLESAKDSPELQFESDDEESQFARHPQPSAPEADLDAMFPAQHLDEYDNDGSEGDDDENEVDRYIPESQRDAYDAEGEPPELQFQSEADKMDNRYFTQSQSSAQEVDQDTVALHFEHDKSDAYGGEYGDDDDGGDDENRFTSQLHNVPVAGFEEELLELRSQSDNLYTAASHYDDSGDGGAGGDDNGTPYNPQLQNVAQVDVEEEIPESHFQRDHALYAAAYHHDDIDDDGDDDDDDGTPFSPQLPNVAQVDVEEEIPESHFQRDHTLNAAASHYDDSGDGDDDDDDDDDGTPYTTQLQNVAQVDVEEEIPESHVQRDHALYAAAYHHDNDDDGDDDDDGTPFTPQLQNVAQADVEEEIPESNFQRDHALYAAACHHDNADDDGDEDDDDDGNRYVITRNDNQGVGPAHEQQSYDTSESPSVVLAYDNSDAYDEQSSQNVPEDSRGLDHGFAELQYGVYDAAVGADEDENLGPSLIDSPRSVEPEKELDDEQSRVEDFYQQENSDYANYEADDGSHDGGRYIETTENVAQEPDDYEEEPDEQEHLHSYEAAVGVNEDDNIRYAPRNDESEPTVGYDQIPYESQQHQSPYHEDEHDDYDNNHGIIGSSAAAAAGIYDDEDNPRVLIKGILAEDDIDQPYTENAYEEEEEGDTDDVIDIRDNANVEDQFIEFEDSSYVEAAVGGILDNAGLNGESKESQEEVADDELGATGEAATGADDGGDHGAEGVARASTSRVRFAGEEDPDHEHRYNNYHDRHADADDYHIIPGASNQSSHDSHDYDHAVSEEKSLDVLLLEEICEEAASMTIKEALIHSLKPNVRAGLTTAHLKLSESEVLALEEYCEDFVGGLIKDLLKRTSLMELSSETKKTVVKASVIKTTAKHLSAMEVQQLKVYCDHFVHNVIAESIIDSSMIVARQQHQAEEVKELLHMFQNSEELQEYFTNLTTDIVRTALLNVTAKGDMEEDIQDSEQPIESSEYEQTESVDQRSYPGEGPEFENQEEYFDFDGSHSFGIPLPSNGSAEYRRSRSQESWASEDEDEMGNNVAGRSQRINASLNQRSASGHTTLEFDEEWAEGVIGNIEPTADGEKRQKIFMRELDFDDRANVGGTELLAPVFLAVAEENEDDTEFEGLRRKTQSIEDLCDLIEEEKEPPRKRASSLTKPKKKPRKKPRPNSFHDQLEELKKEAIKEDMSFAEPEEEQLPISPDPPSSPKTASEKSFYAYDDERYRWHTIRVNNREKVLDLRLIEPYMKVITHGGVHTPTRAVIVVIAACYLPEKTKKNYDFLMEQLFFYLISTLELLATTDEYFLVYFNGGTTQSNQPALPWMKRFYQHVEGGLKKNMINMFIVHPNFWLKTVVRFAKAFVGTNFWSKLQFIKSLEELSSKIPVEFIYVPDEVVRCDPKYKRVHNL